MNVKIIFLLNNFNNKTKTESFKKPNPDGDIVKYTKSIFFATKVKNSFVAILKTNKYLKIDFFPICEMLLEEDKFNFNNLYLELRILLFKIFSLITLTP